MAESLIVIGAAASVISIIDILARSISTVRDLRDQWKNADFTLLNLNVQLTALKAALTQIKEWTESDLAEPHHQLVMDLDDSVTCCRILAGKIDGLLSELQKESNGTLDMSAKVKLVLGSKSMDDLQKMIERQTNALTLLLTASNFRTMSEQKVFLEKSSTRKTLKHATNGSASLIVHCDTASLFSRYTDNLSKISMVFNFDSQLFGSKVYERTLRGSLKTVLRQQQSDVKTIEARKLCRKTEEIEKQIRADKNRQAHEVKILLLGANESDKSILLKHMRLVHNGSFSELERKQSRVAVFNSLITEFQIILREMFEQGIDFEDDVNASYAGYIASDLHINLEEPLREDFLLAFTSLWADKGVQLAVMNGKEYGLYDSLKYFSQDFNRLFVQNYLPTDEDICRTESRTNSINETTFELGKLTYRIFDIGGQRSERKKWLHKFDNVQVVLFTVGIDTYDHGLIEDRNGNRIHEALMLFESIANSLYFEKSCLLLFFTKIDVFREKVATGLFPIRSHSPDYKGKPTNPTVAQEFFANKFRAVVRQPHKKLYVHYVNAADHDCLKKLMVSVQDMIVRNNWNVLIH